MSKKSITVNERKKRDLEGTLKNLQNASIYSQSFPVVDIEIGYLCSINSLNTINIDTNVEDVYEMHTPSDENSKGLLEWSLAKVLFFCALIEKMQIRYGKYQFRLLLKNTKKKMNKTFSDEYEIKWNSNKTLGEWIKYIPIKLKTIVDNLGDINEEIAKPIIELLLDSNKTDQELVGHISTSYAKIEDFFKNNKLDNLNEYDKKFAKKLWNDAKKLANNIEGAKGHKGKSELSVRDIIHCYAFYLSLFYKLEKLNEDNKKLLLSN